MKKKILILLIVFLSGNAFGQPKEPNYQMLTKQLSNLYFCYTGKGSNGKTITDSKLTSFFVQINKDIATGDKLRIVRNKFPIYYNLIDVVKFSLENNKDEACKSLKQAYFSYFDIDTLSKPRADSKRYEYKQNLNLDLDILNKFLEYSKNEYGFNCFTLEPRKDYETEKKKSEVIINVLPFPIKNEKSVTNFKDTLINIDNCILKITKDTSILSIDNRMLINSTPVDLLIEALDLGFLNSKFLNLKEITNKDPEYITALEKDVRQYVVDFKADDLYDVFYFESMQYTIDWSDSKHGKFEIYTKGLNRFKETVLAVLKLYLKDGFEIYITGSADKPTFTPLKLKDPFTFDFFENIKILRYDKNTKKFFNDTIKIGETYDNNELPDLRAAFVKYQLLEFPSIKYKDIEDKVHILKGSVYYKFDVKERKSQIVLAIDIKKVTKFKK